MSIPFDRWEDPSADIVDRMRAYPIGPADMMALLRDGAAEIERLRERCAAYKDQAEANFEAAVFAIARAAP